MYWLLLGLGLAAGGMLVMRGLTRERNSLVVAGLLSALATVGLFGLMSSWGEAFWSGDPLISAWSRAFPGLEKPRSSMPAALEAFVLMQPNDGRPDEP